MALNDAVPSSATDVFKRNAEDADRLLNATGNVTTRTGKILPSWDEITQTHAAWNNRGAWVTATAYAVNDIWEDGGIWYAVLSAYTSGATAAADIAGPNVAVLNGNFGSAATKDTGTDFDQIPLNAGIVYPVESVQKLAGLIGTTDNQQISIKGWHADSDVGGGILYWDSTKLKSEHNGGTVFSPTVPYSATTGDYLDGIGETDAAGSGCWCRTYDTMLIEWFGVIPDGTTDATTSIEKAIQSLPTTGGELVFSAGDYLLSGTLGPDNIYNGIHLPHTVNGATAGKRVTLTGRGARLVAGREGMHLIRVSSNFNKVTGFSIAGYGVEGTSVGISIAPDDLQQTTTKVENTWNVVEDLNITGCEVGIFMACGPTVSGATSTCYYNSISKVSVANCKIGAKLSGRHSYSSAVNRNVFNACSFNAPNMNVGVQLDGADTNRFIACDFEGITYNTTPLATPTAISIPNTGAAGWPNAYNYFSGCVAEYCTLHVYNGHNDNIFNGNMLRNDLFEGTRPAIQSGQGYAEVPNDYTLDVDGVISCNSLVWSRDADAEIVNKITGNNFLKFFRYGEMSYLKQDLTYNGRGIIWVDDGTSIQNSVSSNNATHYKYYTDDGVQRGSISVGVAGTNYNTTSDPRLKTFIGRPSDEEINAKFKGLTDAFDRFKWNGDATQEVHWGFNAHKAIDNLTGIAKEGEGGRDAIIGEVYKTTYSEDGNPVEHKVTPAAVDMSKAVPILLAKIAQLEEYIAKQ
tara:strand:- start:3324 stop:5558 length:2235 start_codon:yes stop_codon:yes gene_type:complete